MLVYGVMRLTGTRSSRSRLFANCIAAVDASTGQYVRHYQTATPPSGAEEFHILVANMVINGSEERVVMIVPRNGCSTHSTFGPGKQFFHREESMGSLSQP